MYLLGSGGNELSILLLCHLNLFSEFDIFILFYFIYLFIYLFICFLGQHLWHMEVPMLGV